MQHAESSLTSNCTRSRTRRQAFVEWALVFLVFFVHAGWAAPEVNEPHYLGKAKHYWNPEWCPTDFFLNTADAHEVFYFAFGWLTMWLPLPAVAWCGRVLVWGLLAWAWQRLSKALDLGWLYSVLSAALFVALNDRFHMAGEWVVGGVEAKGFAWALVFFGLARLIRGDYLWALVLMGGATAFHVIVGGWALVAVGLVWIADAKRPSLGSLILPGLVALMIASWGLVPALLLTCGADAQSVTLANRLYVYERLPHHLLPERIPTDYIVRHVLLVLLLIPLALCAPPTERFRRLRAFVAAGVGLSAVGFVISLFVWSQPDVAASLLRFYWFRMSDVLVPLGAALLASATLWRWHMEQQRGFALALIVALVAAGVHLGDVVWQRRLDSRAPADRVVANVDDWRQICEWAAEETPPDALFIVPRMSQTFRWYSGRGEVVSRKDLPQDAAAIVEWGSRLERLYGRRDHWWPWYDDPAQLGAARLKELSGEYGADYVVASAQPPLALERVGPRTTALAVYRLPSRSEAR